MNTQNIEECTVENFWQDFYKQVYGTAVGISRHQYLTMRQNFYAGFFNSLQAMVEASDLEEDRAAAVIERFDKECMIYFKEEIKQGLMRIKNEQHRPN